MSIPTVLLVEDDQEIREIVAEALRDEGHAVVEASNGFEALRAAAARRPALVLLDMQMPVMNGWEFARAYRGQPGPLAPIVVMTAGYQAADVAREIGAVGYLAKPFDLRHLLAMVRDAYAGELAAAAR